MRETIQHLVRSRLRLLKLIENSLKKRSVVGLVMRLKSILRRTHDIHINRPLPLFYRTIIRLNRIRNDIDIVLVIITVTDRIPFIEEDLMSIIFAYLRFGSLEKVFI